MTTQPRTIVTPGRLTDDQQVINQRIEASFKTESLLMEAARAALAGGDEHHALDIALYTRKERNYRERLQRMFPV
jgi:hypothetical protein